MWGSLMLLIVAIIGGIAFLDDRWERECAATGGEIVVVGTHLSVRMQMVGSVQVPVPYTVEVRECVPRGKR